MRLKDFFLSLQIHCNEKTKLQAKFKRIFLKRSKFRKVCTSTYIVRLKNRALNMTTHFLIFFLIILNLNYLIFVPAIFVPPYIF